MTGIYLFGKDENGKRIPKEIEYLTREELDARFLTAEPEDILDFLDAVCKKLVEVEKFLADEGYVQSDPLADIDLNEE